MSKEFPSNRRFSRRTLLKGGLAGEVALASLAIGLGLQVTNNEGSDDVDTAQPNNPNPNNGSGVNPEGFFFV